MPQPSVLLPWVRALALGLHVIYELRLPASSIFCAGVVLALLQAGQRRAVATGTSDHKNLAHALKIFGDTTPDKVAILTGSESDPGNDPAPESEGLWNRVKRSFGA